MPKLGPIHLPEVSVAGFEGWVVYYALFVLVIVVLCYLYRKIRKH